MKRNFIVSLVFSLFFSCLAQCLHVHTEECGEKGKNCTHECFIVEPFFIDHEKPEN